MYARRFGFAFWEESHDPLGIVGPVTGIRRRDSCEERFVKDGVVWSATGVSAGIDMTLAFIAGIREKRLPRAGPA